MALLDLTDLRKSFTAPDGTRQVVVQIPRFSLDTREKVALYGPSGTGKTTFLHLIAGILAADAGTIRIAGQFMTGRSEACRDQTRAAHIGYIFQTFNLLQGFTARENVRLGMAFGGSVDNARADELLRRVGLGHRLDYFPRQLSTGQQQRVAVARALANRPQLVLADEPTGNLDATNGREVLELIREACTETGAALLLVSHDPAILGSFSRSESLADLNHASQFRTAPAP
jgi:putative ABC transport system ATP-binding protein